MSMQDSDSENEFEDIDRENKLKKLEDKLDGLHEQLEMNQEDIDRETIEKYYLTEHYNEYSLKEDINEDYLKAKKKELENSRNHLTQLQGFRSSIMDSIDRVNCQMAVTEMSEFL